MINESIKMIDGSSMMAKTFVEMFEFEVKEPNRIWIERSGLKMFESKFTNYERI